ncbi:MAG: DinB family protein [Thermomicrobiales bacterium]|nr:DinB family protein [Thermomicrobiales bacterium]
MNSTSTSQWLELIGHGAWADEQLLDAAARLSAEDLQTAIGPGGYGSLFETLVHIHDAQKFWFDRARGKPLEEHPVIASLDELRSAASVQFAQLSAYVTSLDDEALDEVVEYRSHDGFSGALARRHMLLHQALHAQQHRGEVALALTRAGRSPGEIDFDVYLWGKSREG